MKPDKKLLEEDFAFHKPDSDFAAAARLKQSLWRKMKGYKKAEGKHGNYLDKDGITLRNNFLTDKIKTLVQYEVFRSPQNKKLISEPKIWENLLSSQPLAFNLFGELHFDLKLATRFFRKLYPESVSEVTNVLFEHSPGRGNPEYSGDHSAFDVFIEFLSPENKKGFIGIEVKYAENMKDSEKSCSEIYENRGERYVELSQKFNIFQDGSIELLKNPPLQQVWRDHVLAISTLRDYDLGFFVFLYPKDNTECAAVVNEYQSHLKPNCDKCMFIPERLEDYVNALKKCSRAEWINQFAERYL